MRREGEVAEEENAPVLPHSSSVGGGTTARSRVVRRADPFLILCRCFSVITSLAAILCIVVNVLSAIRSFKTGSNVPSCSSSLLINRGWLHLIDVVSLLGFRWHISVLRRSHSVFGGSR